MKRTPTGLINPVLCPLLHQYSARYYTSTLTRVLQYSNQSTRVISREYYHKDSVSLIRNSVHSVKSVIKKKNKNENQINMANIYIIENIKLGRQGLQTKDESGNWVDMHCQQGRLDGACVVYSAIMALLCMGYLNENDINIMTKPDRRTRKGKLLYHLFEQQGLIRDGYYLDQMADEIQKAVPEYAVNYKKGSNVLEYARETINEGLPVIIKIENENRQTYHAVLAIGMEYEGEGNYEKLVRLLCLDPACGISKSSYWNCVIDVSRNKTSDHPFWYITDEDSFKVDIKEIITFEY